MLAKTTHVLPADSGWIVKRENQSTHAGTVYATQREAIGAARKISNRAASGQIVIHSRGGSLRWTDVRGLPSVSRARVKSSLGTNAIKRAVSTVLRRRLENA